jgi:peptide-methionine (S)-S-oxide reductase
MRWFGSLKMESPKIGRGIALVLIVGVVGWNAMRVLGARAPEAPKLPFPAPAVDEPLAAAKNKQTAVLAGGCFWGIQAVFEHVKGVSKVTSGYAGGHVKDPSYESVSMGVTGHAETVRITYDSSQVTFGQLLMIYFSVAHDPTQWNRQGPDTGSQYRSAIFFTNEEQRRIAEAYIAQLEAAKVYSRKIVTAVEPFKAFYPAEDYHQDYLNNNPTNPYIVYNDLPKLENLKKVFPALYRR